VKIQPIALTLSLFALSTAALADDDCTDPVSDWQPRETLRLQLEEQGWDIQRIKVDDGCYEVKALDANGHRVKAEYAPASLNLMEIKIKINRDNAKDNEDFRHLIETFNKVTPAPQHQEPSTLATQSQ